MSLNKISPKTIARFASIQTIYQYQVRNQEENIENLIKEMIAFYKHDNLSSNLQIENHEKTKIKISVNYFADLTKYTSINFKEADNIIIQNLALDWKIADLQPLLLAMLRVAITELKFFPETPFKVVINEYSNIAADILGDHEIGFVNSILDKAAKKQ